MRILGISALYHDSAATIIEDGEIIAAAQEERFTRKKHDLSIPINAIKYCLNQTGITAVDVDAVVYYDNPLLTLNRFIKNTLALGKASEALIERTYEDMFARKLWVHKELEKIIGKEYGKLLVTQHHISHAASAFFPSPYDNAIILTIDGVGEWETTTIGVGRDNHIELKEKIDYPHSLGLLYSAFTYFCGFKVNSGDYKFMGLAPYGKPIYYDLIKSEIIDVRSDGSYKLNLEYFDYYRGGTMINEEKFSALFSGPRRMPESIITRREMDIAASVQKIVEEVIVLLAKHAKESYGEDIPNLVLAGGVALNCVANGKLKNSNIFENIWIQPAAGDAGGALGAALYAYYEYFKKERVVNPQDSQKGSYLGVSYSKEKVKAFLDKMNYPYHEMNDRATEIASQLVKDKVIGLFQGRMEYGPRALGNRSIVASCCSPEMQSKINLKIKYRESFRPFAPSVLEEEVGKYFELDSESPYMLLVENVREERRFPFEVEDYLERESDDMIKVVNQKRSDIPAVTHVDYSARIQTVNRKRNQQYYDIIKKYQEMSGYGVIVNTSFNVRGEPIVCSLEDAYTCFMRTEMDVLVLEDFILYKEEQPSYEEKRNWREIYELD